MIKTLMLIDDEKVDHMLYQRIIKRSGLVETLLPFYAADTALDYISSPDCPEIDAITLDINMPRMNGFEFLEEVERMKADRLIKCVIVMLTTSLDPADEQKAQANQLVKEFLYKPLMEDHLMRIDKYINSGGQAAF